ncbi:beta strand repeat-containing protein, partial [Flavobacterium sp. ZT3R18]|uniref:beta strand repeat-containing protein n=1 Tax=Flavobacterium sp. ZT3R18 TaxID=2594429 RepID=UPI00351B0115
MKKFYLNSKLNVSKTFSLFWIVFLFGNSIVAQTTTIPLTTPGSNTWTVPCGVTSITIEAWGGGGAGGAATINPSGGSGGGGGGYSTDIITVSPGQVISYTVGAGGTGGTGDGGNGITTTILSLIANGGGGGLQDIGAFGTGGIATGGATNTTGGDGSLGSITTGGAGGDSPNGGTGGATVSIESSGNAGTGPGGGGGGGLLLSAGASNGGNGADGQINIMYTTPTSLAAPIAVTPSSGIPICNGASTNLNATSVGNTINWYTVASGGISIGSSASGVNFSVSPTTNTTYYAEAQSSPGCVSSSRTATALVTVNAVPVITTQPATPTAVCAGSGTRFINVAATTLPLTYQWRKNGVNLVTGAPYTNVTTATLTITNPAFSENGASFDVIVTNAQGCIVTSNAVILTVNALPSAPTLVTPSSATGICAGASTNLNATSTGNTIYWYTVATGGANIGTSASGVNFSVTPAATTTYYAEARSAAACISSSRTATALITVNALASITTQPVAPAAVCAGSGIRTISVTATGASTYQWRKGGVDLTNVAPYSGVTTATLTITNPAFSENGATFNVVINGAGCPVTSNTVTLTVNDVPSAPTSVTPSSTLVVCGSSTNLNATSAGNTIYWYTVATGGANIGTSASGANFAVSPATATTYYAEARSAAGCISSSRTATGSVTVNPIPVITVQPVAPATACAGSGTTTISVTATGVATYQWRRNGVNLTNAAPYSGVTTATLTITSPATTDSGSFDVVLNSATCPVTSNAVTFTVNASPSPPTSVTPSSPLSFCSGAGSVNLNATSAGNTIYWYTVATGGASIGSSASGANFSVTPASTITYYAEARNAAGCNSARTATATITVSATPIVDIEFTERQNDNTYTINTCGNIAASENDLDVYSGNPAGVGAQTFGTATGQWQVSYNSGATWQNAPGPTSTTPQYVFDPVYTTFENVPGVYYFRLIITNNGCPGTSDTIILTVNGTATLTPGSITANQSSCAGFNPAAFTAPTAPTGGVGNFSYIWQSSTDNINFTTISGATASTYDAPSISQTTYYRRWVISGTNGGGCSAVSNTITVSVGTLPAPVIGTITQPTCALATGSVVLSGLPGGSWTINPGNIAGSTVSTTISGLAAGTYNFTVTQSSCTSLASANVGINAQPVTPAAPTASVTIQPTCTTPKGTIVITVPAPAGNVTYTVTGTAPVVAAVTQAGATFANLNPGTYSVTTTNSTSGCTSSAISLSVNAVPANPAAPTASVTIQPTCTTPKGTIVIMTPAPAGNVTYTVTGTAPVVAAVTQAGATFANLNPGTYSVTTTNTTTGCTSSAISLTVNAVPANPAAPTASVTIQPNCSVATGTIVITAPAPAANVTYTVTGTAPVVAAVTQAGATFANLNPGTYSVTTTNTTTGCTSSAISLTVNTVPANPAAPTASVTIQPTCSVATGTIVITAPAPAANVTYTVTGTAPVVAAVTQASATFANLNPGTYSVITTNTTTGCTSSAISLTVNAQPTTPAVPTLSSTPASCLADGTSTISNYLAGNTYTFTPAGPTAGVGGLISGMTLGTSYTVTASSGGCTSAASASFSNAAQVVTPAVPTLSSTPASCLADGTSTISNYL